jgi:hypothetical protein
MAVDKQIEAGVDIGNNGEQQREAFFLYVRHRMSGFGDSWQRWPRGDVERYPVLKQQMAQMLVAREAVGNYHPPKAIGEVRYIDDTELNAGIADFRTALEAKPTGVALKNNTTPPTSSGSTRISDRKLHQPLGAHTPASKIFRISSFGTGSGFSRRIDRVVRMISNRSVVSEAASGVARSVMSALR